MTIKDMARLPEPVQHTGTGATRSRKPIYQNSLPPCNQACPAGNNIQKVMLYAQEGDFRAAWQAFCETSPMPSVFGRVCYHPCEGGCNRVDVEGDASQSVRIHGIERFLGDLAIEQNWQFEPPAIETGKKVLVVGAGPCGLSAAYHLRLAGHQVEIREAGPVAGGMLHFGIPAYRLPRDILQAEVDRLENIGVTITLNHKVEDLAKEKAEGGFDVAFIAIGAHIGKRTDIPAREAGTMLDAVNFLHDVGTGQQPKMGRRVAVYGGGNTAMDAARTAKRMDVDEVMIIYRRDREHMPAHDFEAEEALAEGVKIHWLRTIQQIEGDDIQVEEMEIGEDGRPKPTGRMETLQADTLIMALGQNIESQLLANVDGIELNRDGTVQVAENMMTGHGGVFAGGDMVPSDRTATIAVGHGRKAANHITAWLNNTTFEKPAKNPVIGHEKLHLWYRTLAPQQQQPALTPEQRNDFSEVVGGLTAEQALFESARCYSCGNCFECDGCYGSCPEGAIQKLGKGNGYKIDYQRCTGCSACYDQCPCHAIEMVGVEKLNAEPSTENAVQTQEVRS
ncbi:NAD(P)-binding protein [Pelagibaculum spongiae]|uniref:Glutamate synthase n=1 Tax=Pelagibaculum spongiae TaxID=2080658 RepID=A0A2V1H5L3_9GAMM|nr:NAD(P)-binding protein [Pelagibaculum spongiae]PVZ71712.1 glutamate synthase [Pelagibaculum spongiae]